MVHVPDKYVWLTWSTGFLVPWLALFVAFPGDKKGDDLGKRFNDAFRTDRAALCATILEPSQPVRSRAKNRLRY